MPGPFTSVHRMSWNANGEADLAGYKVYAGRASGVYGSLSTPINAGNVLFYDLTLNDSGTWYFVVTAYDTSNNESAYSAEVVKNYLHLGNF
jgi:hypothetical protein